MDLFVFNSIVTVAYSFTSYTITLQHLLQIPALTLLYTENQLYSLILPCVIQDRNSGLQKPGCLRSEIEQNTLSRYIPSELQYACCYWVHHLAKSQCKIGDRDEFHLFLNERFLCWLEVLSLIGRISTAIGMVTALQSLVNENDNPELADFLRDAQRFILANHFIANIAPLQLYCSSLVFAPQRSVVRSKYGFPKWLTRYPPMEETWSVTLQTLEGHSGLVNSVAFSPDGKQLASCSNDRTVKIWDASTGSLQQTIEVQDIVYQISFHPTLAILDTNIGQIELGRRTVNGITNNIRAADNLHVVKDWIMNDDKKILWLPPEYRSVGYTSMGQTFVLGSAIGRVMFFEFSFEGSGIMANRELFLS